MGVCAIEPCHAGNSSWWLLCHCYCCAMLLSLLWLWAILQLTLCTAVMLTFLLPALHCCHCWQLMDALLLVVVVGDQLIVTLLLGIVAVDLVFIVAIVVHFANRVIHKSCASHSTQLNNNCGGGWSWLGLRGVGNWVGRSTRYEYWYQVPCIIGIKGPTT